MEAAPSENFVMLLDLLKQIALKLPFSDLKNYCAVGKQFQRVCQDPYFWAQKLEYDYNAKVPEGENPYQVYLYYYESGDLYTFGNNYVGELGDGTTTIKKTPTFIAAEIKKAACGLHYTAIVTSTNDLYTFGANTWGALGTGDNVDRLIPILVSEPENIRFNVKEVACGYHHTAVILENGHLYTFGSNSQGELGTGDNLDRNEPTYIRSGVKAVSCGESHTAIILKNGDLYTFGKNLFNQLGVSNDDNKLMSILKFSITPIFIHSNVKAVACGDHYTVMILENGEMYAFGYDIVKPRYIRSDVRKVACFESRTAIILVNGDLHILKNINKLVADDVNRDDPIPISTDVKEVACGRDHTAIIVNTSPLI